MASTSSTISVIISGAVSGLLSAVGAARAALRGLHEDENGYFRDAQGRFAARGREIDGFSLALKGVSVSAGLAASALKLLAVGGGAGGAVAGVVALAVAVQNLLPVVLLLPAAIGAFAAAKATFALATQGFADAVGGDAEALKGLAPAAREAALAVRELKDGPLKDLQQLVQQKFFEGFSDDIGLLADTFLPRLRTGMEDVATAFAEARAASVQAFSTPENAVALGTIFANTAEVIRQSGDALGDFASGFIQLGAIGSEFLPRLTAGFEGLADRFRSFVEQNPERIRELINTALAGFNDLFAIVGNIGATIGAVFRGLSDDFSSPLAGLAELTGRMREFFESAAAQGPLKALGETLRVVSGVIGDVLVAGLQALGPVIQAVAPFVSALAEAFGDFVTGALGALSGPLTQVIQQLSTALAPILPVISAALVSLANAIAPVINALAGPLAQIISTIALLFAQLLSAIAPIVVALAPLVGMIAGALADALTAIAPMLAEVALIIADAFVLAIQTLQPLIPPLLDAFLGLIDAVIPLIPPLVELAVNLLPLLTASVQIAVPIVSALIGILTTLFEVFGPLITAVLDFTNNALAEFNAFGPAVSETIGTMTQTVVDFFQNMFELSASIVNVMVTSVTDFFTGLEANLRTIAESMTTAVTTFFTDMEANIRTTVDTLVNAVQTFFRDMESAVSDTVNAMVSAVTGFVGQMQTDVQNFVGDMATAVVNFFRNMGTDAVAAVRQLVDDAIAAVGRLGSAFLAAARNAVDSFVNGIRDGIGRVGQAARDLANAALAALNIPLEIGSPSRATRRIGEFTSQGLALGMLDGLDTVIASAREVGEACRSAMIEPLTSPTTGIVAAAREALGQLSGGGGLFEDFTFRGASPNLRAFNDALVEQFQARGGGNMQDFLRQLATVIDERPVTVNVDLDGEPVRHAIRVGLAEQDRESARTLRVGPGVTW